ncbi:MAG: tagaturonate reductase [Chryseolinea sp.]
MLKKLNRETASGENSRPVKVLQFGGGNFLRAFADWMIDVLNEKTDFNGAIQIIQPIHNKMGKMGNDQDGLYHVVLNGIQNGKSFQETRLITSVVGMINPFENFQQYLQCAENPDLKFVLSNTTEAGITFNANDTNPKTLPETFPGKLTVLLHHRYKFFDGASGKGLTIMPCELIEKNGENLKNAILQYITHWNLPVGFKNWVEQHTIFCNTLVDRIVPGFPKDNIKEIQKATGFEDNLVVMAEPFHLWVIEAPESVKLSFPTEKAGLQVKFVNDLTPYRTRKVRILNGAHTALVPVAYLYGLRTVRESVDDSYVGDFIRKTIVEEIIPTLDLPKDELNQFANDVMERFQNPFIRHELMSIALNSISKFKVRVLPSLLRYIEIKKQLPERLILSLASLIRFYKGEWKGDQIALQDTNEVLAFFSNVWKHNDAEKAVLETLANTSFWDQDLTQVSGLAEAVVKSIKELDKIEDKKISIPH